MIKRTLPLFLVTVVLCLFPAVSLAVPAYPGNVELRDANGNTLTVRNQGDEFFSYMTDTSGNLLFSNGDGYFYYVVYDGDGYARGERAGGEQPTLWGRFGGNRPRLDSRTRVNVNQGADGLREKIRGLYAAVSEEKENAVTPFSIAPFSLSPADPAPVIEDYDFTDDDDPLQGMWRSVADGDIPAIPEKASSCPLLILKVEFDDVKCLFDDAAWSRRGFSTTEKSIADYYARVSNDQFTFVPVSETSNTPNDGVITVTLPIRRPVFTNGRILGVLGQTFERGVKAGIYTGTDGKRYRIYNNTSLFAYGLAAANEYVDFGLYDRNKDGYISPTELAVLVVAAGHEASMSHSYEGELSVWASSWIINNYFVADEDNAVLNGSNGAICLDGVAFYKYTIVGENLNPLYEYNTTGPQTVQPIQMQIGTPCHELGHDLGLMDLYNTSYAVQETEVLSLSLMALGSWGMKPGETPGSSPTLLDPYSKIALGFYEAETVAQPGIYPVTEGVNSRDYNILRVNTSDPDVYYLVENRAFNGYDAGLDVYLEGPGGAVYWRIDEGVLREKYASNRINTVPGHYGVMPDYIVYYQNYYPEISDGPCTYRSKPFRSDTTLSLQQGFPVENTHLTLSAFDAANSPVMNVWISPFGMTALPDAAFPQESAPDNLTVTLNLTMPGGSQATPADLESVSMDGDLLNAPKQYKARLGSIILALEPAYLNTLKAGRHTLRATLKNGLYAETQLIIAPKAVVPKTGDFAAPGLWAWLLAASGAGLWGLGKRRKAPR